MKMKDTFRKTTLLSYASSLGNRSSSLNSLATPIKSKYDVSTGHLETISDRICAFSHHTKVNSESLGYSCSPRQEKRKAWKLQISWRSIRRFSGAPFSMTLVELLATLNLSREN